MTGCTSTEPTVTTQERAQMRTRTVESDFDTTFRAMMIMFENNGYMLDNTDMDSGLIRAYSETGSQFNFWTGGQENTRTNITATVIKLNDYSARARINVVQDKELSNSSGKKNKITEVDDALVYNQLFQELRTEIERLKATL